MATTKDQIEHWVRSAVDRATHLIVVCDTYDYSDYPIVILPEQDFWKIHDSHHGQNMQRVMEVYDLSLPISPQLDEHRANHCPPREVNKEPQS